MTRIYLSEVPGGDDYPDDYWENRREHVELKPRYKRTKQDEEYWTKKNKQNEDAARKLNSSKGVVMSALSDIANSTPFTGAEIKRAADNQRQEKLDKWHQAKNVIDATATVAEAAAAGYGILRGLTHLRRLGLRRATQSTGQAVSSQAMRDLANYNRLVQKVDDAQIYMNSAGGLADAYQWFNADNKFDKYENGVETGLNIGGVIGGANWFRNLPYLRRIGGDKIDAILDGMGYSAATWDVIKNLPPLSGQLNKARENFK